VKQKSDSQKHNRRSIRLSEYNCSQVGTYFITICTHNRECLFGDAVDGTIVLNEFGKIVCNEWNHTAQIRKNVRIEEYIVMPNTMHGIFVIVDAGATRRVAPTNERLIGPIAGYIGAIIGQFKSIVTKRINTVRDTPALPIWQRNYYEHIIRNEDELNGIRESIIENSLQGQFDRENPEQVQDKSYYNKWSHFEESIYGKTK
jgi:REP element-mobilizing transposase RayT